MKIPHTVISNSEKFTHPNEHSTKQNVNNIHKNKVKRNSIKQTYKKTVGLALQCTYDLVEGGAGAAVGDGVQ